MTDLQDADLRKANLAFADLTDTNPFINESLKILRAPMCNDLIKQCRNIANPLEAKALLKQALHHPLFATSFHPFRTKIHNLFYCGKPYQTAEQKVIREEIDRLNAARCQNDFHILTII